MSRGKVYNKVFTEELWEQVNKENKDLLDDFIQEYKQRKMSPKTIQQYYYDLRIVMIYMLEKEDNKSILQMQKKNFRNLSIWLSDTTGRSSARVNRIMSCVRSMLSYAEDENDYDYENNIAKKVKGLPKKRIRTDENDFYFTFEEYVKVRDILVEKGKLQLAAMWALAFDSGGRRDEIFQIKKQGLIDRNYTNIVEGKGSDRNDTKRFPLVYLNDTREIIKLYLEERGDDDMDSMWITGSGKNKKPIEYGTLYDRILICNEVLSEVRGEKTSIFFHTTRHSRAECLKQGTDTRILDENGKPRKFTLEEVMLFLHHNDTSTTQLYLKDHSQEQIMNMFGFQLNQL